MNYEQYIGSAAWAKKRLERLEIDGHKCAVCHVIDRLSVHHLHYESLGDEDPLHDLITLCPNHHQLFDGLERFRRYALRKREVTVIETEIVVRQEIKHGLADSEVQIDVRSTDADALRRNGRSAQQMGKIDETDFREAPKNRRRSS